MKAARSAPATCLGGSCTIGSEESDIGILLLLLWPLIKG